MYYNTKGTQKDKTLLVPPTALSGFSQISSDLLTQMRAVALGVLLFVHMHFLLPEQLSWSCRAPWPDLMHYPLFLVLASLHY